MKIITFTFLIFVIYQIVAILWITAEKFFYGQITTRGIDSIVALILAVSLYLNLKYWVNF